MFQFIIILILSVEALTKHSCNFDSVDHPTLHYVTSTDSSLHRGINGRMLQQEYENPRIHADYSLLGDIDEAIKNYVQNEIMPSTISYYQAALKVKRLQENLKVEKICMGHTPPDYLRTDGAPADFVLLVAATNNTSLQFVATAMPCGQSLIDDRPVYGVMTFNLAYIVMDTIVDHQENLSTALHEMVHLLGFSSVFYPFYRNYQTGERLTNHIRTKKVNGVTVTYIDVEPLTTRLREYYDCSTLEGAYLENEGQTLSVGSHFERRVFMNEFMTASSITEPVISEFTLALLSGTGWYQVDYSMSEPFNWGRGAGCEFIDGSCTNSQGDPKFKEFCNTNVHKGCTFTARAIGFCGISEFNDTFADNCPYYASNTLYDCGNTANQIYAAFEGEIYGPTSRCFTGSLTKEDLSEAPGAFCLPTTCTRDNEDNFFVIMKVGDIDVICTSEGKQEVPGFVGTIDCPEPNEFCRRANPQFCEKGCTGKGRCVAGVCQCDAGWQGVDCSEKIKFVSKSKL